MRVLPVRAPSAVAAHSSAASRATSARWWAKCSESRWRFCTVTYSTWALAPTDSSTTPLA